MGGVCEDDGRRDDASQHGEGMLESEEQGEQDGHAVVKTEEWCCSSRSPHKGKVRPKQESVVVCSNKSVSVAMLDTDIH